MAGLKLADSFAKHFCSEKVVFRIGWTIAVFKSGGTTPEAREVLMILLIVKRRTSRFSYSSFVGMGSRSHELGTVFWRISKTNCSVTGVNVCSSLPE